MNDSQDAINEICRKRKKKFFEAKSIESVLVEHSVEEECEEENFKEGKIFKDKIIEKFLRHENFDKSIFEEYKPLDENILYLNDKVKRRQSNTPKLPMEEGDSDKQRIERRLEDSDKALSELIQVGTELVTNVKVANEKREVVRRNFEASKRQELIEDLRHNSIEALVKFDVITSKWSELNYIKEPMSLYHELKLQKESILELMKQKDNIIFECQKEIHRADKIYANELERQSTDIYTLVERIDNQVELITNAYNDHIELLQQTIELERQNIAKKFLIVWEGLHHKSTENEQIKLDSEKNKSRYYEKELEKILLEHEEITRGARIRLEKDAEKLQLELRKTKHNVFLETEKLDYNFKVLQKRDDESTLIRTQQRKRLNKLNETIFYLNNKIKQTKIQSENEINRISKEILQLHRSIGDLQSKTKNFTMLEVKKNKSVWEVHDNEAKESIMRILEIDEILHEHQLGTDWVAPRETSFPSLKELLNMPIEEKNLNEKVNSHSKNLAKGEELNKENLVDTELLKHVLNKLSNQAEFLIGEKLDLILKPYTREQTTLMKINSIFSVLGITDSKHVKSLTKYFLPYIWCSICSPYEIKKRIIDEEIKLNAVNYYSFTDFDNGILGQITSPSSSHDSSKYEIQNDLSKCNHKLVIEPPLILTGLRKFVEANLCNKQCMYNGGEKKTNQNQHLLKCSIINQLNKKDIESYWKKYKDLFPENKRKLWKFLGCGLNHYLKILKEREELNIQCEILKKQNLELNHLLQKFKPKELNQIFL